MRLALFVSSPSDPENALRDAPSSAPARTAEGGAWLDENELVQGFRNDPRFAKSGWFLPGAVVLLLAIWVASYFGVPAALINGAVLALIVAHFWPIWLARDSVRYWAPVERYLRFRAAAEGIETWSVERALQKRWASVVEVYSGARGFLIRFADAPPLWVPRTAFSSEDAEWLTERLSQHVVTELAPAKPPRSVAPVLGLVVLLSVVGTALWVWAVR